MYDKLFIGSFGLYMKKKERQQNKKDISIKTQFKEPNKKFLKHLQAQVNKMSELLGEKQGEQFMKDSLKEWPRLLERELKILKKSKD